jgi:hypothetical protein
LLPAGKSRNLRLDIRLENSFLVNKNKPACNAFIF